MATKSACQSMMVFGFLWNQAKAAWTGRWEARPVTQEKAELAASQDMGWFQGSRRTGDRD